MRRRIKRVFAVFGILLLLLPILGYIFRGPIKAEMSKQLEAQLIKEGIHATYTVSKFNLMRGLILSDVSAFETEKKETPILALSKIAVKYDLIGLIFSGGSSAVHLTTKNLDLTLWENEESYTIAGINTDVRISRNRIKLDQLEAAYGDIRIDLVADVEIKKVEADEKRRRAERKAKEEKEDPDKKAEDDKKKRKKGIDLTEAIAVLKQVPDTPDGEIVINLDYSYVGNAKSPSVEGTISGRTVNWKRLTLNDLSIVLDTAPVGRNETAIEIKDVRFKMTDRAFSMAGTYNPVLKQVSLARLESTLNPKEIIAAVIDDPLEPPLPAIPSHRITAVGLIKLENPLNSSIRGTLETFDTFLIPIEDKAPIALQSMKTGFTLDQGVAGISDLYAELQTLSDPVLVSGKAAIALDEKGQPTSISLDGISIERDGGSVEVLGVLDPLQKQLTIKQLNSDIDFVKVLVDLGLDDPMKGKARYTRPPEVSVQGIVALENPLGNDITATLSISGDTIVEMPEGKKPLVFRSFDVEKFAFKGPLMTVFQTTATVGDPEAPTSIQTDLTLNFQANEAVSGDENKKTELEMTTLHFKPLHVEQGGGKLDGEGHFDAVSQTLTIAKMESNLDIMALLGEFGAPDMLDGKVVFAAPPAISLVGEIAFTAPEATKLKGRIVSETGLSVPIGETSAISVSRFEVPEFSINGNNISIPKILATTGPAESPIALDAKVSLKTGPEGKLDLSKVLISRAERRLSLIASMPLPISEIMLTELNSNIDILAAMADFGIGDPTGGKVKFKEPPLIVAEGMINLADMTKTEAYGSVAIPSGFSVILDEQNAINVRDFSGGECKFSKEGLTIVGLSAVIDAADFPVMLQSDLGLQFGAGAPPTLSIRALQAKRGERELKLDGMLGFSTKKLVINSFSSTLDPLILLKDLGIGDPTAGKVSFKSPPTISATGELALADVLNLSNLTGSIKAPDGILIPIEENKMLEINSLETSFGIGGGIVSTPKLAAETFGGVIQANLNLKPATSPLQFEMALRLTNLRLEQITGFFDVGEKRTGLLSADFSGGGSATIEGIQGAGAFSVSEAKLINLPFFRGLRPLLLAINLGEWKSEDSGAAITCNYVYDQGILTSDNIELLGDFYKVKSKMNVNIQTQSMSADGALSTTGATRVLTEIVGKILEVEASGPFDDINWKLKNALGIGTLKDIATLPGGLLKNTLKGSAKPGKLIHDVGSVTKGTLGNTGSVAKGALEGVGKKLLGGLGLKKQSEPTPPEPVPEQTPAPAPLP
ncbi:MAG: hypothetical protein ACKVJU_25280 [Verrucomicrobiales bacterium]